MLSKKHFIELADVIRTSGPVHADGGRGAWPLSRLKDLADFCARQNPRFNRERWLGYIAGTCGKNGGKVK